MKEISLSGNKATALVDNDDFDRINQHRWQIETRNHTLYAKRTIRRGGKTIKIYMHREVLSLTRSGTYCDHQDHNGLNNQKSNLRPATPAQNAANTKSSSQKKFRGVYKTKSGGYRARIKVSGKDIHIGCYADEIDAAQAYDRKALESFGPFAITNF